MIIRTANRQTVAWFVDLLNRQLIDTEPPYQRRSVWTESYRRYFIDTIMRNYSSPPIFLNSEINSDGIIKYFVVDGKQRLESIIEFVNDKIAIPDNFGDRELDGKYFSELSDPNKKKFWGYEIAVEYLSEASEETINATFDRLNRNVLKLTPQELRHAKFDGKFITLMNNIVAESFWTEICISRTAMIRRMRDIEFISELFLLTMHGIQTTTKDSLDEYYGEYDDEIPDERGHRRNFDKIKKILLELNLNICSNRLKLYSDFYSLWSALLESKDRKINLSKTKKNILEFMEKVEEKDKKTAVKIYTDAVSAQPNSAKNREIRKKILVKLITSK